MTPDIRYYLMLVSAWDAGTETIYENTARLIAKTRLSKPATTVWQDNLTLSSTYGNTTWGVNNDPQVTPKVAVINLGSPH